MRLTCPNCSARYEVSDDMIPPEGRDVQCSNCTTTWFQPGRRPIAQPVAVHVARDAQGTGASAEETAAPTRPERPQIDPGVRDILREEAEREARLRRGADPVETQSEMPLDEEADAENRARRRAELDGARDAFDDEAADDHPARKDLLPDIEEINSTLRPTDERSPDEEDASDIDTLDIGPRRRRGARTGFLLILLLSIAGVLVYSNADEVAEMVPQAGPYVMQFEELVNTGRFWLDDMARNLASATSS